MGDTCLMFFRRGAGETPGSLGTRLRGVAEAVAVDARVSTVVLFVDDGAVGAPPDAKAMPSTYDAMLMVSGIPPDELPACDAAYEVSRRVIKERWRRTGGARSEGFTVVCPSVRADFLDHDAFDAHWRDQHSRVHVASSPGTCHYEQLVIDAPLTSGAPRWDGVGLLSFASGPDYVDRMFSGPEGQRAIFEDIPRFLDLSVGQTLPASEYVYRDDRAGDSDPAG